MPYISTNYMQQREVLIISLDLAISSVIESESYVRGGATHSEIVLVLTNLLQKYARELHRRERNAKDPDINNPDWVHLTDEDVVAEAARGLPANPVRAAYIGGTCPDCGNDIPPDVVEGAGCEFCWYVFYPIPRKPHCIFCKRAEGNIPETVFPGSFAHVACAELAALNVHTP